MAAASHNSPPRGSASTGAIDRRSFLQVLLAALATGCSATPGPLSPDQGPPLHLGDLSELLSGSQLRWLILTRPRDIAAVPWLIPPIAKVAPEANLDRFATTTGVDLRQITDAAIAAYAGEGGPSTVYLVRHQIDDAGAIERLFRQRLVTAPHRSVDRSDVIRISGKIGTIPATLALLGPEVAAFQFGGSATRGPARVAALYATEKLKKSPTALAEEPLRALAVRLGSAPVRAFALGPFDGELARGARGLLAGATAIGASARPSAREGILVAVAVMADFTTSAEPASRELARAWNELAGGSFGHLLGLDQPVEPPIHTHAPDAVAFTVQLNPERLARGLSIATGAQLAEIMR